MAPRWVFEQPRQHSHATAFTHMTSWASHRIARCHALHSLALSDSPLQRQLGIVVFLCFSRCYRFDENVLTSGKGSPRHHLCRQVAAPNVTLFSLLPNLVHSISNVYCSRICPKWSWVRFFFLPLFSPSRGTAEIGRPASHGRLVCYIWKCWNRISCNEIILCLLSWLYHSLMITKNNSISRILAMSVCIIGRFNVKF